MGQWQKVVLKTFQFVGKNFHSFQKFVFVEGKDLNKKEYLDKSKPSEQKKI